MGGKRDPGGRESLMRRLRAHQTPGPNGCIEWTGRLNRYGYGAFTIITSDTRRRIDTTAHRVAFELHHGEQVPAGLYVLHRCDNRKCTSPEHLFIGTQAENMRDMVLKGRSNRGTKNGHAKLTEGDVRAIWERLEAGESCSSIATDYPVCTASIRYIKTGKSWAFLTGAGSNS